MADVDMSLEEGHPDDMREEQLDGAPEPMQAKGKDKDKDKDQNQRRSALAYRTWIRSLQAKLLALAPEGSSAKTDGSDTQRRGKLLQELEDAYREASQTVVLSEQEWQLLLNIHVLRRVRLGRPLSPAELEETVGLHERATTESVGVHVTLYAALVSLLVGLHGRYAGLAGLGTSQALLDEDGLDGSSAAATYEVALPWTGCGGCGLLQSIPGAYAPESIALLAPTASQAEEANLQQAFDDRLGEDAIRAALRTACSRCAGHVPESHKVWHFLKKFELTHLQADPSPERTQGVQEVFLARLKIPHQKIDETFQSFSSFVTRWLPASDYETTMASANRSYAPAKQALAGHQRYEDALRGPNGTYYLGAASAWAAYLSTYTNARPTHPKAKGRSSAPTSDATDPETVLVLFERCLAIFGLPLTTLEQEFLTAPPHAAYEADRKKREKAMSREDREQLSQLDTSRWKQAESVWEDLGSFLATAPPSYQTLLLSTLNKAIRAVPGSGLLIALLMRSLAMLRRPKDETEQIFNSGLANDVCAERGTESLVSLLVGRVDIEREYCAVAFLEQLQEERKHEADQGDEAMTLDMDTAHAQLANSEAHWAEVYAILEYALSILDNHISAPAPKGKGKRGEEHSDVHRQPDSDLTLQRYITAWAERLGAAGASLVEPMWESTLASQGGVNIRVWQEAANFFARKGDVQRARTLFKQASGRRFPTRATGGNAQAGTDGMQALLQAKTALLQDWVTFEHSWGSSKDVQYAISRSKAETAKLWEAYYQRYTSHAVQQAPSAADCDGHVAGQDAVMDSTEASTTHVDTTSAVTHRAAGKRKADEDEEEDGTSTNGRDVSLSFATGKKGRPDDSQQEQSSGKRDREHSSVVVANMPPDATQAEVRALFNRCGHIQTLSGPIVLSDGRSAAVVEFANRSAVTGALTRNGKSFRADVEEDISVFLGHDCTLYVTNFPEETTDGDIRERFGKYGPIFSVRWPSKKFSEKRRFVYVQYANPEAAKAALVENGVKLSETTKLVVALSDPDRKKKRSDAQANLKELYITGLPRVATVAEEVRALFEQYGTVDDLRIPTAKEKDSRALEGQIQGIAFVDMHTDLEAQRAMRELNSTTYRGKVLSVTLAAPRGASHVKAPPSHYERGAGGAQKARSVIVRGLPLDAQEGLIQQTLDLALGTPGGGSVKGIEWTPGEDGKGLARVELRDAAVAGKLLLLPDVAYDGKHPLSIVPLGTRGGAVEPRGRGQQSEGGSQGTTTTGGESSTMLLPRAARTGLGRGRGRGGLGFARPSAPRVPSGSTASHGNGSGGDSMDVDAPAAASAGVGAGEGGQTVKRGQDDFRAMLRGNRG
ncbi:unnamed protein product [Tilletia controversa]|uniref:U4/U6 snRNA-associated-splicing factor PRP24 n=1 Tax=Tilletia caries TaxID=13290 RepID=A0A177UK93_9BASI|nr:hypothetical protein CF328_g997 [Tilletia controversa]KAE8262939.1 hypothetical protein A4X03_0g2061 [Tilletia caries]CAD6967408.1 unnamed protein product [Tilletia controversa]CAD7061570.1 unnamed protein product [Tilletia caries]